MEYILSTLVTAAVFVVLILLLAAKPRISKIISFFALGFGGICGLLIYGYGYAVTTDHFLLAILKAVLSVCRSFVGTNDYGSIAAAPFMKTQGMQILCAFVQMCSLYATASAVIKTIGTNALKHLRLWLGRRKHLNIIYGTTPKALQFGSELATKKDRSVIFVDSSASAAASAISNMGCVLLTDSAAVNGSSKFLRRIGFSKGKRRITLYALTEDSNNNIRYATRFLQTLEDLAIPAEQTHLVLMAQEEAAVSRLQRTPKKYGYGFVMAVNEPQMAARLLMMKYPPCNYISFDQNGRATENFEALLIGFGQVGQAVLKALVMNGQFEGSHFKLDVFARDINNADGHFAAQFGTVLEAYDIHFHADDARSRSMYTYLKQHSDSLRYIVVSAGESKNSHEIAEEIIAFLHSIGRSIPIYKCTRSGVVTYHSDGTVASSQRIYSADLLCDYTLDQQAMILNHRYQPRSEKTALQNWMECDYFSRQSCRAATDYIPALLRAAGKSAEQAAQGHWALSPGQIENLSRTEHLRWCAFHYCMGFSAMDPTEYAARTEVYIRQKAQTGKPDIRIGKNMSARTHACLIPWEELDALSAKESAITGKNIDYKAMDTDNILAVPLLLQAKA